MCACIVKCHTEFDSWQAISIDKLTKENTALRSDVDIAQREVTHAEQSSGGVKALQAKIEFYQVLVSCVPLTVQSEIEAERQRVTELEEKVAATDRALQDARKKVRAAARGAAAGQASQQSQLRTLENRLETVRTRACIYLLCPLVYSLPLHS